MDSRLALTALFLVIFSPSPVLTAGDAAPSECAEKLLVCQPYLTNPVNPPADCCTPLKDAIANDLTCLCGLFKNKDILKFLNVTTEEALRLPKACGVKTDISLCDKGPGVPVPTAAPTSQPSIPSTNSTISPAGNNTKSSASRKYGTIESSRAAISLIAFSMALFV